MDELDVTNATEKIGAKCFVESSGKVNCSEIIYEDERSWRKSRNQIDLLIQVLKSKISDLKGIKKHLKHNKPSGMDEDDSSEESASVEDTQSSTKKSTVGAGTWSPKKLSKNYQSELGPTRTMNEESTTAAGSTSTTDTDDELSFVSSSVTPSFTTSSRATKSPAVIVRRPAHRANSTSTAHRNHSHHQFHNGTSRQNQSTFRRPTPANNENATVSHRPNDQRRNGTRHHKHGSTTPRKMQTTTSATASTSTTASTSAEDPLPMIDSATTSIESLITFIGNMKSETQPSTTDGAGSTSSEAGTTADVSTAQTEDERKGNAQGTPPLHHIIFENTSTTESMSSSTTEMNRMVQSVSNQTDEVTERSHTRAECFCEPDIEE